MLSQIIFKAIQRIYLKQIKKKMIANLEDNESIISTPFEFQKEKLEALTIRIPTQIKNQLKKKAEKEDLSLSQILRKLIKEYLS